MARDRLSLGWGPTHVRFRARLAPRRFTHVVVKWSDDAIRLFLDGNLVDAVAVGAPSEVAWAHRVSVTGPVRPIELRAVALYQRGLEIRSIRRHYRFGAPLFGRAVAAPSSGAVRTGPVAHAAAVPGNTVLPAITGTAKDGQTLTSSTGTWSGSPTSYARAWQRCDAAGANCVAISGATAATYLLTSTDVGKTIRVKVTATNASGSGNATSAATATVLAAAPVNTAVPAITGTAKDGQTLTSTTGTWTGTATITYARQWRRCDTAGANCVDISGATATTFVLSSADVGKTIRVVLTATNGAGSASATSTATATVTAAAPVNTALPTISGTAKEGQLLTASTGTWTGSATITYTYQWQSCNSSGASCVAITGATQSTYRVTSSDVTKTLKVAVTATNGAGNASATSAATAVITTGAPVNLTAPTLAGTAAVGQTLTTTNGTWAGTATITYARQWKRCNSAGASCVSISGATGTTYTLVAADVASTIRATWTATNGVGSASTDTAQTALVTAPPPTNTAAPTITGTATDGQTLTSSTGTWTGTGTITYTRQWKRCDGAGANCINISGATGTTYALSASDIGATIRVAVTATNSGGSTTASSTATAAVLGVAPSNTAVPTISGTVQDGQTLTAATGSWVGSAPITYTYRWQRCGSTGTTCADLDQATSSTYTLSADDIGTRIRLAVTATNATGNGTAFSAATVAVAGVSPANSAVPSITGAPVTGRALTLQPGAWSGSRPLTHHYTWQRCSTSAPGTCQPITSAHSVDYTLQPADLGAFIRVEDAVTNISGQASSMSAATGPVTPESLSNTQLPQVDGLPRAYHELSASKGQWTVPTATVTFQWQRCGASPSTCTDIAGADDERYDVDVIDVGSYLRVVATATAGTAQVSSASALTAVVSAATTTQPQLALAGDLVANPGAWLTGSSYTVQITGTAASSADGLAELTVTLDGEQIGRWTTPCSTAGCTATRSATVATAVLDEGAHDLIATVSDADGNTSRLNRTVLIDHGVPEPPSQLLVEATAMGNSLSWSTSPSADTAGYSILRRTLPTGSFSVIGSSTDPEFVDALPPAGVDVEYAVQSEDQTGQLSTSSVPADVHSGDPGLAAPANLQVDEQDGAWHLTWNGVTSAAGYVIYEQGPDDVSPAQIDRVEAGVTTWVRDTEDEPGAYVFQVRAVDSGSRLGTLSSSISRTLGAGDSTDAPSITLGGELADGDTGFRTGTATLTIDVTDPEPLDDVAVEVDGQQVASWQPTCSGSPCHFTQSWQLDTTSLADGDHQIRVAATNARGRAADETVDFSTDNAAPAAPAFAWLEQTATAVTVHWSEVDAEDLLGYAILDGQGNMAAWNPDPQATSFDLPVDACASTCTFAVAAWDQAGRQGPSAPVQGDITTQPAAPTLSATAQPGAANLTWTSVPNGRYLLFRTEDGSDSYAQLTESPLSTTSYVDSSVVPGNTYNYVVRALDAQDLASEPSTPVSVQIPHASSAPTISLTGSLADHQGQTLSSGTYHLTAQATSPVDVDELELTVDGVSVDADATCVGSPCSRGLSFDFQTADYGDGQHLVQLTATDAHNETTTAAFSVTVDAGAPAPVTAVRAALTSASAVHVQWDAPDDADISGYRVYRGPDAAHLTLYDDVQAPDTSYDDSAASPTNRWYAVSAIDQQSQESSISNAVDVAGAAEQKVVNVHASAQPYAVTVSWDAAQASDLTGYAIYRRTDGQTERVATVAATATSFVDDGVVPGTALTYLVRTTDLAGREGPDSDPVDVTAVGVRTGAGVSPVFYSTRGTQLQAGGYSKDLWIGSDQTTGAIPVKAPCQSTAQLPCTAWTGFGGRTTLDVSPNGRYAIQGLLTGPTQASWSSKTVMRDLRTGEQTVLCDSATEGSSPCQDDFSGTISFTPSGTAYRYVASAAGNPYGSPAVERPLTGGAAQQLFANQMLPSFLAYDIRTAADGSMLVSGEDEAAPGSPRCHWGKYSPQGVLEASTDCYNNPPFALTPDGTRVISVDLSYGYPRVVSLDLNGQDLKFLTPVGIAARRCCEVSPDGARIMFTGQDVDVDRDGHISGDPISEATAMDQNTFFADGEWQDLTTLPGPSLDLYVADIDSGETRKQAPDAIMQRFGVVADTEGPRYPQASSTIRVTTDLPQQSNLRSRDTLASTASATAIGTTVDELALYVEGHRFAATGDASDASFRVPLSTFGEGRHTAHVVAASTDGLERSLKRTIVIDDTAPTVPDKTASAPDEQDGFTQVSWAPVLDPRLADGTAGSGVATVRYRYRHADGTWTGWSTSTDDKFVAPSAGLGDAMDLEAIDAAGNRQRIRSQLHQVEQEVVSGACNLSASAKPDKTIEGNVVAFRIDQTEIKVDGTLSCGSDVTKTATNHMCVEVLLNTNWRRSHNCFTTDKAKNTHRLQFSLPWICQRPSDGITGFRISGRYQVTTNILNSSKTLTSGAVYAQCPEETDRQAAEAQGWRTLAGSDSYAQRLLRQALGNPPTTIKNGWAAHHIIPKKDKGPGASLAQSIGFRCKVYVNSRNNGVYLRNKGGPLKNGTEDYDDLTTPLQRRAQHWGYGDAYSLAMLPWLESSYVLNTDGNCRGQIRAWVRIHMIANMLIGTYRDKHDQLLQSGYIPGIGFSPPF